MKNLLFLVLFGLSLTTSLFAQETFEFKKVDSISLTKAQIFERCERWIGINFKSAQNVIQVKDKEAGTIISKGNFSVEHNNAFQSNVYRVEFTMTIDIKDGKYRIIINDLSNISASCNGKFNNYYGGNLLNEKPACGTMFMPKKYWAHVKEQSKKECEGIIKSISESISNTNIKSKDDF
jgi:hypothetical protein